MNPAVGLMMYTMLNKIDNTMTGMGMFFGGCMSGLSMMVFGNTRLT